MKRIKTVQIGTEHDHAASVFRSLLRFPERFEVVGYVLPEGETLREPETYKGHPCLTLEEALALPDLGAAVIETREEDLTEYACLFASRGIAVHMDKPGGIDPVRFDALIAAVKERHSVLHLGYMYRYNPAVLALKEAIAAGKLGKILAVEAQMNCMHTPEKRRWLGRFPGGEMFYLGCHLVDLVYSILGEPTEVIPLNAATGADGVEATDFAMAVLRYPFGTSFVKSSAIEPGGYMRRQLVVTGTLGSVQFLPFESPLREGDANIQTAVRTVTENIFDWFTDGETVQTPIFNRYDDMIKAFHAYATEEKQNPFTPDYERRLYHLLLKCCGAREEADV